MGHMDEAVAEYKYAEGEILRFLWPRFTERQKKDVSNQPDAWNMAVRGLEIAAWIGLRVPEELVREIELDGEYGGEEDAYGHLALRAVRWQRELDENKEPPPATA